MTEPLGRRCVLVLLAALSFAVFAGLLGWGPIPLGAASHRYAGAPTASPWGDPLNVLSNLPIVLAGLWGWVATRRSAWPPEVRGPWAAFHACVVAAAIVAALYHAAPGHFGYVLAQITLTAAFLMLSVGALAERVSSRFGSTQGLRLAGVLLGVAIVLVVFDAALGRAIDLRPFVVLQVLPVLLLPAGALGLAGRCTRASDWIVMLAIYAAAQLAHAADVPIHERTGWIGGHTLMHLGLAGITAWMAYCATRSPAGCDASTAASSASVSVTTAS